ncbi:hypothetical protein KIM372_17690 [Bombiscardovia nodaiensis]|uniref:Glycosyl transferase family 1 domain-containing protein n=1 Tax=Bombiscardovia nodaiensis TaxID=2932181 RepID=A0ABN6SCM7_9BIFI|nr:hypothetical protein KIM372_17690 [Bombiscardovia nodaiensis]
MILSIGRLTPQKGFDLLVEVAHVVLPQHPTWEWVVLGSGEQEQKLVELAAETNVGKQLHFVGNVSDVEQYYRQAAMFVLTSRYEGLPMVLLEAKAHRLPVVSFDCETGPSELILDGVNGYLVAEGDCTAMSDCINLLIKNPEERSRFSRSSMDDTERYHVENVKRQWQQLLLSI